MNKLLKLVEEKPWFGHLIKEAKKSTYKHKLSSCLVSGGKRLLSKGYNQIRYHRIGHKWNPYNNSLHAEVHCLASIDKNKIRNSTLYVLRISNDLERPLLAKPCEDCMSLIRYVGGIKRIIYSIEEYPYYKEEKL